MKSVVAVVCVALLLTGCAQTSPLETAVDTCKAPKGYARIGDDGKSLRLDHQGEKQIGGLDFDDVECVLDALDAPDSMVEKMTSTRALDGMQTGTWGDITATWTFHPDDGLDIILELN
jgi:hypothetical protein